MAPGSVASRSPPACASLARPKSRILRVPPWVTIRLPGLRSRWTMPWAWAAARPSASWRPSVTAGASPIAPRPMRLVEHLAVDQLADHERRAVDLADVEHGDDVGVGDGGGSARLGGEPAGVLGAVADPRRHHLDRDRATEPLVAAAVHVAGAAGADPRLDAVRAEGATEQNRPGPAPAARPGRRAPRSTRRSRRGAARARARWPAGRDRRPAPASLRRRGGRPSPPSYVSAPRSTRRGRATPGSVRRWRRADWRDRNPRPRPPPPAAAPRGR